jgi:hypothetical protein
LKTSFLAIAGVFSLVTGMKILTLPDGVTRYFCSSCLQDHRREDLHRGCCARLAVEQVKYDDQHKQTTCALRRELVPEKDLLKWMILRVDQSPMCPSL